MVDMARIAFDWLEQRRQLSPNKTALVDLYSGRRFTYRQFNERTNRLANGLREAWGVRKGDRFAILAKNGPEYLEALFAAAKIGAILVPINIRLSGPELVYIFKDCKPKGLILEEDYMETISEIRSEIDVSHILLISRDEYEDMPGYEGFLNLASGEKPVLKKPNALDDPQLILYTSGTTGYPKGAIQTQGNILFNSVNANIGLDIVSTDVNLCSLPLFHTGGLHVMTTPTIHQGGTIVIMRSFEPAEVLKVIHRKQVNTIHLIPTMWLFVIQEPSFGSTDFSGLRLAWTGGAPCPPSVIEALQSKGLLFRQGYGLTEAGPDATLLPAEEAITKAGSIGVPSFHTSLCIVDQRGHEVPQGDVGEVVLQGPAVVPGYWNKPEATEEAFRDQWFHTGDLGYKDEDGYFFLVDRKKDMYISGGENVYPTEVEKTLYLNPKIAEVAVIGIPDEKWGEVGHAVIRLHKGKRMIDKEVFEFCSCRLARYKIPKSVEFVKEIPHNPAGKVLKRILREPFWKDLQKRIH
ncbi:MAG: long-chain fatty acid--CoA ligase [Deltaproteobacteria bacterium]|nr:long-chain fatty acid--CoA ligase [Deltaproteobacteria bacterium]